MSKENIEIKKAAIAIWQKMDKNEDGFVKWTDFRQTIPVKDRLEYFTYLMQNWFFKERTGSGRVGYMLKPKYLRKAANSQQVKKSNVLARVNEQDSLNNKKWLETTLAAKYLDVKPASLRTNLAKKIKNKKSKIKSGKTLRFWLVSDLVNYKQNRPHRGPRFNHLKKSRTKHYDSIVKDVKVNHSKQNNIGKIEVIDAIDNWKLGFSEGNVIKYIVRAGNKSDNKLEDLQKALFYLKRIIHNAE